MTVICGNCKEESSGNSVYCQSCGEKLNKRVPTADESVSTIKQINALAKSGATSNDQYPAIIKSNDQCPKCGGGNISETVTNEPRPTGCLTVITYGILFMIPIIGWIALAQAITANKKTNLVYHYMCRSCGNSWRVAPGMPQTSNSKIILIIIAILLGVPILFSIVFPIFFSPFR